MTLPDGIRILADEQLDRDDWKAKRRTVTTATQVGVIAGGHPYSTLLDVWNDKTDPEWIEEPNRYLDERAALGRARESEIIAWASKRPEIGGKLTANSALLTSEWAEGAACTPDAYRIARGGRLVIVDAKTTQQNWHDPEDYRSGSRAGEEPTGKPVGVPQHVTDQMLWTYKVLGADQVWLAVEQYVWEKGAPTLVDTYLILVPMDEVRLAFLEARVAEFEQNLRDEIAPESDIDIRAIRAEGLDEWEATDEERADFAALVAADDAMTELAEVQARIAQDLARVAELEAIVKAAPKVYGGRRVHLIGERMIAQLTRYYRVNLDQSRISPAQLRAARSWSEVESVKIVPNPEFVPADVAATE